MSTCTLATWHIDLNTEPDIRVGIVLPQDGMNSLRLILPEEPYEIQCESLPEISGQHVTTGAAEIFVQNGSVLLKTESGDFGPAEIISLMPTSAVELAPGKGITVRGVITGRGFHWEKRTRFTIPGALEFQAVDDHLLVVNVLPLEDYLACVLTSEMSGDCPLEFLKSQAIVARSWVLASTENKHSDLPIERCNDDCCQRYQGTTFLAPSAIEAIRQCQGQIIVDDTGEIIDANYSKSCGGIIEAPEYVWSVYKQGQRAAIDAPSDSAVQRFMPVTDANLHEYLTGSWLNETDIFCSPNVVSNAQVQHYLGAVDIGGGYFRWSVSYQREDLERILREKFFNRQPPGQYAAMYQLTDLRVIKRGSSGRAYEIAVAYLDPMNQPHEVHITDQHRIRDALHLKFLYSSAFMVTTDRGEDDSLHRVTLTGAGWGHGAGLCQIGALGMALRNYSCEAILNHYFDRITIKTCY